LVTDNEDRLKEIIQQNFEIAQADFKSLNDDLKLNIKLKPNETSNDLLSFLTQKAEVNHFIELIPTANDIFIQTIKNY